jgi:hypothetical protein
MPLLDDFYLLAHDEQGRPRLHPRATGIALAGAVLAELIVDRRVSLRTGGVVVPGPPPGSLPPPWQPPDDPVVGAVWRQVCQEPTSHPIRTWLGVLAGSITGVVADRLTAQGVLRATEVGLFRRSTRYVPVDINAGARVKAILAARLTGAAITGWPEAILTGLLHATGLIDEVLWHDRDGAGERHLRQVLAGVGAHCPVLPHLFGAVEAAVGDAVLAHRT